MAKSSEEDIRSFIGPLQSILFAELDKGNIVSDSWHGNWPFDNTTVVQLKYPFKTSIKRNLDGIKFNSINDPHYWKAEYHDEANRLMLTCGFRASGDFEEL